MQNVMKRYTMDRFEDKTDSIEDNPFRFIDSFLYYFEPITNKVVTIFFMMNKTVNAKK